MREGGEDDDKGMVNDVEGVPGLGGRETLSSMRVEICVCVAMVVVVVALMVVMGLVVGVVVLVVAVGVVVLVIVVRVLRELCIGMVEVVGVLRIGTVEVDCTGVVDFMVLGGVFVVEMVEGVELVVGCVVRLVLWRSNGRGCFLCCFSLMSFEMNGLSLGRCLFGMVIWANFLFLERKCLGKMVSTDVVMEVVVEFIVGEAVDVVQAGLFVFSRHDCLGDMMDVKMVVEVVVGVVVLVWWRSTVVWEWVWQLAM